MIMGKIVLDPALREKLNGLSEQMEVRDENDQLVGVFLPAGHFQALVRNTDIPFSEDELRQFRNAGGGCSLAEFWKRMGVS